MHMKTLPFIIALTFAGTLYAQPDPERHFELGLSGLYQSFSGASNFRVINGFLISPRLGYEVAKGFEIEPEATLVTVKGSNPAYILNGNVSYNFISTAKAVPFLLLGYGTANEIPFLQIPSVRSGSWMGVLNIGGGVKGYLTKDVAMRVEYRYQTFSGQAQEDVSHEINTVQFGFSVLL